VAKLEKYWWRMLQMRRVTSGACFPLSTGTFTSLYLLTFLDSPHFRLADAGHQVTIFYVYTKASGEIEKLGHKNIFSVMLELPSTPDEATEQFGNLIWKETLHAHKVALFYYFFSQSFDTIISDGSEQLAELLNSDWDFVLVSEVRGRL
jgi:hypothetical protein